MLRGLLDKSVHADGAAVREPPDEPKSLSEIVAVDIRERDWLHYPEPAGLAHCCHQFGIAAGIHRAADEREFDTGMALELGGQRLHGQGDMRHLALTTATTSPAWSTISALTSRSIGSGLAGIGSVRHSAVSSPRAFL